MIMRRVGRIAIAILIIVAAGPGLRAQQAQQLLTNADVVKMVKNKLPESVVISAIQTGPSKFDTSADAH